MTMIDELRKNNFKPFMEALHIVSQKQTLSWTDFNDPKNADYKEQCQEIYQALEVLFSLIISETREYSKNKKQNLPAITLLKDNTSLFLYTMNRYLISDQGFAFVKDNHDASENTVNRIFSSIHNPGELELFFLVYPDLKNTQFLLKNKSSNFLKLYDYFNKNKIQIPSEVTKELIKRFIIELGSPGQFTSAITALSALLSENADWEYPNWERDFPWENLNESTAFLFEYLKKLPEQSKIETLEFLSKKYPNLVYNALLKGNFFVANQLISLGLGSPNIEPEKFLTESIENGLRQSHELRKYHALSVLLHQAGIIEDGDAGFLQNIQQSSDNYWPNVLFIEAQIPALAHWYCEKFVSFKKESATQMSLQNLNQLMLSVETDYALALSSLYDTPVLHAETPLTCARGVTIPRSSINKELVEHWQTYGHRAHYYSFLGYGINRGVNEYIEEGPELGWGGSGDATFVAPTGWSSAYACPDTHHIGYLLEMSYHQGQPVLCGDIELGKHKESLPSQLLMHHISPENIQAIHEIDIQDLSCNKEIGAEEHNKKVLSSIIKPYLETGYQPYQKYLNHYEKSDLLSAFNQHCENFSPHLLVKNSDVEEKPDDFKKNTPTALFFDHEKLRKHLKENFSFTMHKGKILPSNTDTCVYHEPPEVNVAIEQAQTNIAPKP